MRQPHKIIKHTQIISRLLPTNCVSVFYHSVGLVFKGLTLNTIFPKRKTIRSRNRQKLDQNDNGT